MVNIFGEVIGRFPETRKAAKPEAFLTDNASRGAYADASIGRAGSADVSSAILMTDMTEAHNSHDQSGSGV